MSEELEKNISNTTNERLPCRGCTASCLNYPICNGTPWRLAESVVKQNTDAT